MRNFLTIIAMVFISSMHVAQALPVTVDPESIVPLPDKFDMERPAPDVPLADQFLATLDLQRRF